MLMNAPHWSNGNVRVLSRAELCFCLCHVFTLCLSAESATIIFNYLHRRTRGEHAILDSIFYNEILSSIDSVKAGQFGRC
jgi:hypothetical protein